MEDMPVNGSAPVPAPRQVRRAASLCAFAAVVLIVIGSGLILLLTLLTRNIEIGDRAYADLQMLIGTVVTYLVATPAAWALLLRRIPQSDMPETAEPERLSLRRLLFFFPCAFFLIYAGALIGRLVGALLGDGLYDAVGSAGEDTSLWVLILCTGVIGPAAEELFFRKAMMDRLAICHPVDAILYSALLFALIHGNLAQFLYAFPVGVLLGVIYYRTQNIRYTILLHAAINIAGGVIPVFLTTLSDSLPEIGGLLTLIWGLATVALCVLGLVFLIAYRSAFLPIRSEKARIRKPLYCNAGFIVACVVFVGMFVINEILG